MAEALVSMRVQGETRLKRRGDILVAKPNGSVWGSEERSAVIQWEDADLDTELASLPRGNRVIIHPYAEFEVVGSGRTAKTVMVNRSSVAVDIDALASDIRQIMESRDSGVVPGTQKDSDMTLVNRPKTDPQGGTDVTTGRRQRII